jgi:hypothetical protein
MQTTHRTCSTITHSTMSPHLRSLHLHPTLQQTLRDQTL